MATLSTDRSRSALIAGILAVALLAPAAGHGGPAEPVFSPTGPDAADYGAGMGYPVGSRATTSQLPYLVGAQSHFDDIIPARSVVRPAAPMVFKRAAEEARIFYTYQSGTYSSGTYSVNDYLQRYSVDDYLQRHPATGLLILKDDTILLERYQYARTDKHRFTSYSMAKTITAMLIGIAVGEGKIRSIDDVAQVYVPELSGTEYGGTPLRALLTMSSGVEFLETYSGSDDIAKLGRDLLNEGSGKRTVQAIGQFNTRIEPTGTKFRYASIETEVLGLVLARAVGMSVADYLSEKIWRSIGAEADASWSIDRSGQELTYCCFNAVLRDYARLGRLLAHDGVWAGEQIIPRQWLLDATTVRPGDRHLVPGVATSYFGYGYQTWLFPGRARQFALLGIRGQVIYVDPASKLVMVQTAVRRRPSNDPTAAETGALWRGVVQQFGG